MDYTFLDELNDSQRAAVEYCDGPSLVIAGAGSGKTRVLTYKIAYLLSRGMKPWNILALTFTNKAANEMKQRIGALEGDDVAKYLYMGTFHSIFSRILRVEAERLGYTNNFTIYDESDSRSLIKTIIKEMQLDDKVYKPASVHSRISMAKNNLLFPDEYAKTRGLIERDVEQKVPAVSAIYSAYCERCKKANAMDFDDLLTNTYRLLVSDNGIRKKYAERFRYILVDEYQDTNSVQQKIVWLLSEENMRVCAVGDDAQSIYAFRGANIDNILDFQKQFAGTRLFKLERNYRSTQRIVQAANSLIRHNERQIPKDVYSCNAEGDKLSVKPAYSDREEAIIVCNEIKRIKRIDKCGYNDFAVLYRTNSQSRSFEEAMRKVSIPYKIYGGLSFYQRKEIKDVIAYFRLIVNPDDEEAFKRIINYPKRGIGDTTVGKIASVASENGVSLWQVICEPSLYGFKPSKAILAKLGAFKELISGFIAKFVTADAYTLGVEVVKLSGISADIYQDRTPENVARQENVEELLGSIQEFVESRKEEGRVDDVRLTDFLQEVSLQTDLESDEGSDGERVSLMTVHSAKGLEFPVVFVVGLEENIFPSSLSMGSKRELEEERRLLYVAITRAERHCILTYAKNRYRYGKVEMESPSRFLTDIAREFVDVDDAKDIFMKSMSSYSSHGLSYSSENRWQNSRPVATQFKADPKPREALHRDVPPVSDTFSPRFKRLQAAAAGLSASRKQQAVSNEIKENSVIEHERFGIGTVIRLEGSGENTKATVQFKNAGIKQLLLKFARFKIIG
ncbi:UvrD-helicase domain-containing protein [uncultured Prevotella sp.]|uniref:ATP-dependent helicase n=1 Tax=uncultured Prevotella sp. TaxID=159272 RepID=UPI0025EE38E6|nr:UvrD-helicase domain-containing protein [uncultured Prevotella sp.]